MSREFEIVNSILVGLFRRILSIEEEALVAMDISDLTMNEIHTIEAIGLTEKGRNMGEIAKNLDITVGTLTISVNRLIKKGYATRFRTEEDRRVVFVTLTESGKMVYEKHMKFHQKMTQAVLDNIGDNQAAIDGLANLKEFFERYHPSKSEWQRK